MLNKWWKCSNALWKVATVIGVLAWKWPATPVATQTRSHVALQPRSLRSNLRSGVIFFFASLLLWLEREKNNAWYIHLTSRQPPPSLHNLTSAWPVMLLANNRLLYRSQIFARILGKRKFLSTSMLRWRFDSPPKFKCVVFVMKYC